MIKNPIPELKGKNIAILAMGNSQLDYHKMVTHSKKFDEVWAINAMVGVLKRVDRAFIMDPVSRFFDTDDAGNIIHDKQYLVQFELAGAPSGATMENGVTDG